MRHDLMTAIAFCLVGFGLGSCGERRDGPGRPGRDPGATPCVRAAAGEIAGVKVWKGPGGEAFLFEAGLMIDADGAPDAYHPDDRGRDYLANAGYEGNWWALATANNRPDGKPLVQGPGDPFPGYYISKTALEDENFPRRDPARYVDSSAIPYIVLPGGSGFGARLGDLAVVINTADNRLAYAIYADIGPADKLGEGSIALADALGIASNPKAGGLTEGVIYIVFPGSGSGIPLTRPEIESKGEQLFTAWGGRERAGACLGKN